MAKMNLKRSYGSAGQSYGPGENVEVPDEVAKKIRAYQKEREDDKQDSRQPQSEES